MAKFPKFPLWTDAYLGDTHHLTTLEHGAYLLLLIAMWRTKDKALPADDASLARYSRLTIREWNRHKDVLMGFFTRTENEKMITQLRLRDEAHLAELHSNHQSGRAKGRWLKTQGPEDAPAVPRDSPGNAEIMPGDSPGNAGDMPARAMPTLSLTPSLKEESESQTLGSPTAPSERARTPRKRPSVSPLAVVNGTAHVEPFDPPPDNAAAAGRFSEFWAAYPKREAKLEAERAWIDAIRIADPEVIIAGARRYAAMGKEARFQAMPAKWLDTHRWEDDPPPVSPDGGQVDPQVEEWRRIAAEYGPKGGTTP